MKRYLSLALLLLMPAVALAQPDPQNPEGENLATPPTWTVRLDRPNPDVVIGADAESADIFFVNMTPGWHVTTGPAAIFYHGESMAHGDYRLEATIHLFDPGERREAYGVFMGGQNLDADDISYDYFLLRNTGEFLVKRRTGAETSLIQDWTAHESIKTYGEGSESSEKNQLTVEVSGDMVTFSVNGAEVANMPRSEVNTEGMVGLRINHALNVHISDLSVTAL